MANNENAPEESAGAETPASFDDELGSIFDKITSEAPAEAEAEEPVAPAPDDETETPPEDATEDAPEAEIQADDGDEEEVEAETPSLDAPASWSATSKGLWPKLDPELQNEILKREADWQRQDGERAKRVKGLEAIDAALEPVRQQIGLAGVEPAQYVRQLVAADQFLRKEPLRAVQWIAQNYGVDLSQLNQQAGEEIDPVLAPVLGRIQHLEGLVSQQFSSQQTSDAQRVNAAVAAFMADPANKYAERLEDDIARELAVVPDGTLEQRLAMAYDRAVRLSDAVQAEIAAEKSAEMAAQREREAADRRKKAERIAATNLSSDGVAGGDTPQVFESREQELASIYDQVAGAAA